MIAILCAVALFALLFGIQATRKVALILLVIVLPPVLLGGITACFKPQNAWMVFGFSLAFMLVLAVSEGWKWIQEHDLREKIRKLDERDRAHGGKQ